MAESIFTNQTPTAPDVLEGGGINTAVTFVPAVSGTVTGVRFFAAATVAGTYTGMLYQPTTDDDPQGTGAGTLLGSKVRPTAPTGGAWNVITFDTPIPVSAGVPYRAVVHSSAGRYVSTPGVFASVGITNGNLTAPANGVNSGGLGSLWQGTFRTGALGYPSEAFGGGNYFVDVVFEPTAVPNEGEADFPLIIMLSATGETPGAEGGAAGFGIGFTLAASGEAAGPRLIAPSEGSRLVYAIGTALSRPLLARPTTAVTIYAAETGPALADIRAMDGSTVPGSVLVTDQWSQLPLFRMPESIDTVYGQVAGGPRWPIYAREDDRIDRAEAQIASLENQVAAIVVPDVTDLEADVTALQSDVLGIEGDLGDLTIDVDGLSVAVDYVEGDVTALETLTGTQGTAITAIQAVNVTQTSQIGTLSTGDLALRSWHYALANRFYTPARIAVIGSSSSEGVGATVYGRQYVNKLRDALRARFQPPGVIGGENYIGAWGGPAEGATPAYTWPVARSNGTANSNATGWALKATQLTVSGQTLTYTFTGTSVQVWYSQFGGAGNFSVTLDGNVVAASVPTAGTTDRNAKWVSGALTAGAHTIVITLVTNGQPGVYIHGFAAFNGDESSGIHVYNGGQGSKTTGDFVTNSAQWAPRLATILPHLVVLQLGLNDWQTNVPAATVKANLKSIIASVRSGTNTNPSFVIYGSPQVTAGTYAEPFSALTAAWLQVAAEDTGGTGGASGVAYFDLAARQPSPSTDNTWGLYQSDLLHPTDKGHSQIADALAAFLAPR